MAKAGRPKRERGGSAGRFVEAVLWVADHIGEVGVEEKIAPSGLAWAVWKWVGEQGQDKFFSILLPRALAADTAKSETEERKAERMSINEIESLVRPLLGGVERRFCEKCWRELAGEGGELEGVRVVHLARREAVGVPVGVLDPEMEGGLSSSTPKGGDDVTT